MNSHGEINPQPSQFDYITPYYQFSHNQKTLIDQLDSLLSQYDMNARAYPFSCGKSPTEWFPKLSSGSRIIKLLKEFDGCQLFQMISFDKEGKEDQEKSGRFFIYEHPDYKSVYVALTIEASKFFRYALIPFFERLYPHIITTFISHDNLRKLLEKYRMDNQYSKLIITRASQKFRVNENREDERVMSSVSWPKMALGQAFDWVYKNNGWFQSLQFKAIDPFSSNSREQEIFITRQGIVQVDWQFSRVFKGFISPICKAIYDNIKFFGKRSRRENRTLSAKPLTIDFGRDQFSEVSENKKFIHALKRMKKTSISVIHGNPYIHLSIVDYYDGSTFDLWVLDANQIIIVPQMKASAFSIKRIINHIFDTYAEGDISDYKEGVYN